MSGPLSALAAAEGHEHRVAAGMVVDRAFVAVGEFIRELAAELMAYGDATRNGAGLEGAADAILAAATLNCLAAQADEARGRLRAAATTWGVS